MKKKLFLVISLVVINVKSLIKEHVVVENGAIAEIPKKAYISIGVTVIFHVMVAAVCILPSILF